MQMGIVLEAVAKLANHPTADEVYVEVVEQYPSISRGTVYRNLDKLAKGGVIGRLDISSKACRYDHKIIPHYHARCDVCYRLFDVEIDSIVEPDKMVKESKDFLVKGYVLTFHGICKQCQSPVRGNINN